MGIRKKNRAGFRLIEDRGPKRCEIYRQGYKITDPSRNMWGDRRGDRGAVKHFSSSSRSRLVQLCANNSEKFRYFVTLTYHEIMQDGRLAKKHLNRFLTSLRRAGAHLYIWILEFQERGAIHFHVWLGENNIEASWRTEMKPLRMNLSVGLGDIRLRRQATVIQHFWLLASDQECDEKASLASIDYQVVRKVEAVKIYAMKYGSKMSQKDLPESILGVGRWWGASRGVTNELIPTSLSEKEMFERLLEFCRVHGFPKIGNVVCECEQATEAWANFIQSIKQRS